MSTETTIAVASMVFDAFIAGWLVFTWIYEGHHKRCKVDVSVTCKHCGRAIETDVGCIADRRNDPCE